MTRTLKSALGISMAIVIASAAFASTPAKHGAYLGSYNGVAVYSNGASVGYTSGLNNVSGYSTGYKWQCVEYVNRFYWQKYGKKIAGGNAGEYFGKAAGKGLKACANGGSAQPQEGNILCSNGGGSGHVGIISRVPRITGAGNYTIDVVQQNWTPKSAVGDYTTRHTLTVTKKSGQYYYTVSTFGSGYPIQGWLYR